MHGHTIPDITLFLHGPVGSGKTALATAWLFLQGFAPPGFGFLLRDESTDAILAQLARLTKGLFPVPTDPSDGKPIDAPVPSKERMALERLLTAGRRPWRIDLVSEAGEEPKVLLRSGHVKGIADFAARFARGQPRILGLVLNPSLMDDDQAKEWFKAHITRLCDVYAACPHHRFANAAAVTPAEGKLSLLRTAIETAALSLFLLPATAKAEGEDCLHHLHPAVKGLFIDLPEDARLVCDLAEPDTERRYRIESAAMTAEEQAAVLDGLDTVATTMASEYQRTLPPFKALAAGADQMIVILSRFDLARWLRPYLSPHGVREACLKHIDRDLRRHQVIGADFFSVNFEPDWRAVAAGRVEPYWIDTAAMKKKADGLAKLFEAIDEEVAMRDTARRDARPEPAPRSLPTFAANENGPGDRFAEATWRALRLAPLVLLAVLVLAFGWSGGWQWHSLSRWLIGAGCVGGAAWLWFLASGRFGTPAWRVQGDVGAEGHRAWVDTVTPAVEAPVGELTVHDSALSRLFNVGWVRHQSREALVPQLRRFKALTGLESAPARRAAWVDAGVLIVFGAAFLIAACSLVAS